MQIKTQYIIIALLVILGKNGIAQKPGNYKIIGDLKDAKNMVYLYKEGLSASYLSDSTRAINGHFEFSGTTKDIQYATIIVETERYFKSYLSFFLESGNIIFKGDNSDYAKPSGTYDNNLLNQIESNQIMKDSIQSISPYFEKANRIQEKLSHMRKEDNPDRHLMSLMVDTVEILQIRIQQFRNWRRAIVKKYVYEHPKTYFAAAYACNIDSASMVKAYENLGPTIQASVLGQKLLEEIKGFQLLQGGTIAPVFTAKDIEGKTISLADFKGKFVLLDFWATWCGPCREGNPELIRIYNKYHNKGLEIIGISADNNNIEGWKKAVKFDNIGIWHHTLQIIYPINNEKPIDISSLYKVHSFPTQYLIDKEGKIISDVELKNLENVLKQLIP